MFVALPVAGQMVRSLAAAVMAAGNRVIKLAQKRRGRRQATAMAAQDLRRRLEAFRRWFETETYHYSKRRITVDQDRAARGTYHSSERAVTQADALVDYLRLVRERWFTDVKNRRDGLLVRAGAARLAKIDPALAKAYRHVGKEQLEVRRRQYDELCISLDGPYLSTFEGCLRNRGIRDLLARW